MKIWGFVVAVIALLVAGCRDGVNSNVTRERPIDTVVIHLLNALNEVYVFSVDGHEYIWLNGDRSGGLIHSESCSSPTHIKQ